ncbi:MAG: VanZ family protein [Sandaracinus sp.]|nr:VanZ family protein [Sandaracinus sp.]
MRAFAFVVAAVLASIVVLADTGHLGPVLGVVESVPHGDKLAHFALMGLLAFAVSSALARTHAPAAAARLGGVGVFLVVLAEEISQHWMPRRTFDLGDLAADALGITLGATLAYVLARRTSIRPTPASPLSP